jgi:hypothetical protein
MRTKPTKLIGIALVDVVAFTEFLIWTDTRREETGL